MKRRLGLLSDTPTVDPSLILPAGERRPLRSVAIGVVAAVDAEEFLSALVDALNDPTVVGATPGATAEQIDAALAQADEGSAPIVACGDAVVGRARVDLTVAIDGGLPAAKQPAAFRTLLADAELVLSEPRIGTAVALAKILGRGERPDAE